jgi:hypothetical protein
MRSIRRACPAGQRGSRKATDTPRRGDKEKRKKKKEKRKKKKKKKRKNKPRGASIL